jgi:hypothetical protein
MIATVEGDFFTTDALGTFGGVTLATVAVGNAVSLLFKRDLKVVPFLIALGLCILLAADGDSLGGVKGWIVAVVNGCLVFCTAAGVQVTALISGQGRDAADMRAQAARGKSGPWLGSWLA